MSSNKASAQEIVTNCAKDNHDKQKCGCEQELLDLVYGDEKKQSKVRIRSKDWDGARIVGLKWQFEKIKDRKKKEIERRKKK